ncbi:hypothetical protein GJ744_002017 [Endocarpon pusillum]|uniref:RING-type domain-containing protein n=1 Tax=Endocarpon pusillum TaxID=364733 RepID=A0A8H7A8U6_9EURO|nr:hypothetical protein GJ744_002017 [Endocarpon pusillum]
MNSREFASIRLRVIPSMEIDPCSICLDGYPPRGVGATHAVCQHTFHVGCLEAWDRTQFNKREPTTCPMCRGELDTPHSHARLNSQLIDYELEQALARIGYQRGLWSRPRPHTTLPEHALSSARHESSSGAAASSSSDGSGDPRGYGVIDSMEFSVDSRVRDSLHGRSPDGEDQLSTTSSGLGTGTSS